MFKIGLFAVLWAVLSYIFYLRFPNNYRQPNFFGEEGSIFADNIIRHGFLQALGTTFNGYYIWGLYVLEKIAFMVNAVFYNGEFVNLPRAFADVSYAFFGLCALLPLYLFKGRVKRPALLLTTMLVLFVPLGGWDYGILGTLGQLKFAAVYIAFLLLVYRHYLPEHSKKLYLVDFILLVCAYTNITVYAMLPFALVRYWPKVKGSKFWQNVKTALFKDRGLQSLIVLGVLLLPQLYIIKRDGVPALPGYLDTPYNFKSTIEIFLSRSYLYEILFPINKYLNDVIVVIVFAAIMFLLWWLVKKFRAVVIFGVLTIFLATFLFVIKRTGISEFYSGYKDAGPAQFFFAQNWIFGFLFSLLLAELISKIKIRAYRIGLYAIIVVGFLVFFRPYAGSYGKNDFEAKTVGNIYVNAQTACATKAPNLSISVYPVPTLKYNHISRQLLCTPAALNYRPEEIDLGLVPFENNYLSDLGGKNYFSQTFVSPQGNLNGLEVYFSTFLRTVDTPYALDLFAGNCTTKLQTIPLRTSKIDDNDFYLIQFKTLPASKDTTYCFSVNSTAKRGQPSDPLAVQLSKSEAYPSGKTLINGVLDERDVVFKLHYKN